MQISDEQTRAVAQAIADELMRQEGMFEPPYPALPDDMEMSYIDQNCVDMGAVARAAIKAALTTIEAMGLVVVPKEATPEMASCAVSPALVVGSEQNGRVIAWRQVLYKAMIEAALRSPLPIVEEGRV